MPVTYTLDGEDEALVRRLIESGRFASLSDIVREGLYRLATDAALEVPDSTELKRLYDEGVESGVLDEDGDVTLEKLENEFRALAAKHASA